MKKYISPEIEMTGNLESIFMASGQPVDIPNQSKENRKTAIYRLDPDDSNKKPQGTKYQATFNMEVTVVKCENCDLITPPTGSIIQVVKNVPEGQGKVEIKVSYPGKSKPTCIKTVI